MSAGACHGDGGQPASSARPWADHRRGDAKDDLLKYAAEHPEGAPVIRAARTVLDPDAEAGDASHRLALRFFQNHPNFFETATRDGLRWVGPRTAAFHSTANKQGPKPADSGDPGVSSRADYPKANARAALNRRRTVCDDATRGVLLGALATYRETTEDRFHAFEDTFTGEHMLVPYSTRFNDPVRVADARERFDAAWSAAAERFDRAVMVTLTTDPDRFDSLAAATGDLLADVNRFKSWLATDARLGSRPPSIVVPEFTDSGLPHVHVVLFDVSWVIPHRTLSAYWAGSRDRGEVVWFDRLASRSPSGRWRWADAEGPEDAGGRPPRTYLAKTLADLADLARASPADVRAAADALREHADGENGASDALARAREWWKLAMYYATDLRLFTISPPLKPTTDGGEQRATAPDGTPLPADAPPRWRYVGTARYGKFPAHVRRNATVVPRRGRPPSLPDPEPPPGRRGEQHVAANCAGE